MEEITRNSFGDAHPQYFFQYIDGNEYLSWNKYIKTRPFSRFKDPKSHWEMIMGVAPVIAPDDVEKRMDELHAAYILKNPDHMR